MELLGTSEKLIENVREGVYDRKYWNCNRCGNPGENSNENLKDKIRVARSMKTIKKLLCRIFGHKWEIYEHKTGYWSYDIEMAGYCKRCGYDTHEGGLNNAR